MVLPRLLLEPGFYAVAVPAILLLGIAKGGFTGAFGALAVPLLSLVMPPARAAALILPLLCLIDWWGIGVYWNRWDRDNLRVLLPWTVAGIVVGAAIFGAVRDDTIRVLVGTIAVAYTLNTWLNTWLRIRLGTELPVRTQGRSAWQGRFWGALSGLTSFMAHAGGPPVMVYLLPQRLPQATLVATLNVYFLVVNGLKLVPYAWLGQFTLDNVLASAVLAPLVPVGVHLGRWLQSRVDRALFYRISEIGLLGSGVHLLWQGLA